MRYEIPSFRIDKKDFLGGNNAYDNYPEGGALATTVGINSFNTPGLLAQAPILGSVVTVSLPANGCISWGVGSGASAASVIAVYADATNNASWYTVGPSTGGMTIAGSPDTTRDYKLGITDTAFYNSKFYTTSETDIAQQDPDGSNRIESWWVTTSGKTALTAGVPHPLLVFESILYVADGRYLHKIDGAVISTQVFDVPPDYIITAIVEYNGLIYIVAEPYKNLTGVSHGLSQMFSWDGLTDSWYEQYFLDYRVNALYVYKNILFAWTNQFFGMWTGSEMKPLRPLSNQVFKCQITASADSLMFADGRTLVRYGAPFSPSLVKKFYNYLLSNAGNFTGIISLQNNNLITTELHATASPNYYISDINGLATSGFRVFDFNTRFFTKPVKVRGIVVQTDPLTTGQKIKVGYVGDNSIQYNPSFNNGEFDNGVTSMAGKSFFYFNVAGAPSTQSVTPRITLTAGIKVRNIDYLYEGDQLHTRN